MTSILSSADIVDIRRFCGYPQSPQGTVSAAQLAAALSQVMQSGFFQVSADVLTATIANLTANNLTLNADPIATAVAGLTSDMITVVQTKFLVPLNAMETAIGNAYALLNVNKADVFTRNANEVADRFDLYAQWRLNLCYCIAVAPGPQLYIETPAMFIT